MKDRYRRLFMIGEAAKIANISRKQLRHYDSLGIFSPAYKDPETGYRYYTEKQLREIFLIRDMRHLGMSLDKIGEILMKCEDITSVELCLEEHMRDKQRDIMQAQYELSQTCSYISRICEALSYQTQHDIQKGYVEPFFAISQTLQWNPEEDGYAVRSWVLSDLIMEAREHRMLCRENISIIPVHGRQFLDTNMPSSPIEATFGWVVQQSNFPEKLKKYGGFYAISSPVIGDDSAKKPVYQRLLNYAEENHILLDDFVMERHIVGSSMARGSDKRVIRIYLPIRESFE